jgi:tetratricopeptide (TPR) repeat protein
LELEGEPAEVSAVSLPHAPAGPRSTNPARKRVNAPEEDRKLRSDLAAVADRLRGKSYFEALEVEENATAQEIDAAYERLARKAHPDHYTNASEAVRQLADDVFQLLSRARDTIVDQRRRREYLAERKQGKRDAAKEVQNQKAVQAEVDFQQGELLLRRRDYERALAHFSRAREARPREGEYLAHYAWSLYLCTPDNATVVQEALAHMRRAVKMARDQEKPYLFLGRLCKVVGEGSAAERMFTRAVQIKPDCVEAMRELRLINMRRDKGRGLIGRLLRR